MNHRRSSRARRAAPAQRRVGQLGVAADEHRPVTHVGEPLAVLDHLRVVVRAELDLALVALRVDGQEPDDVGQEGVRRDLALGVLVQEVVDVPSLVTDPEVVRRLAHHVVEQHVVGAEDLVHPPEGVERVQVVGRSPRSPSAPTRRRARRSPGGRLAVRSQHLGHRRLGQPLDLQVGHPLAHGPGDREVAQHVAQADRRADPQGPTLALSGEEPRRAPARRRRGRGVHVDELLDLRVDEHGVTRHARCPAPSMTTRRPPASPAKRVPRSGSGSRPPCRG